MEIVERIASFEAKTVLSRPKKSATQVGKETNQIDKAEQTRKETSQTTDERFSE